MEVSQALAASFLKFFQGKKKSHIQKVKHIKFYLLEKFGVSDIESPNYL